MMRNRREFLVGAGASFVLWGCQRATQITGGGVNDLPGASWPQVERPPVIGPPPAAVVEPEPLTGTLGTPQNPIPRSRWTTAGVGGRNVYAMNGINRITIHHEGYKVVSFDSYTAGVEHMQLLRSSHQQRGFADVGYHFVIDRAGRVWEGRPAKFQGAHVRNNNEHNLGVMCLGNFDIQSPTDAQLRSLAATVAHLRRQFNVSPKRIYTHREIVPTACPGRNMQPRIIAMRSNGAFA
jgi:hypothetical protein